MSLHCILPLRAVPHHLCIQLVGLDVWVVLEDVVAVCKDQ